MMNFPHEYCAHSKDELVALRRQYTRKTDTKEPAPTPDSWQTLYPRKSLFPPNVNYSKSTTLEQAIGAAKGAGSATQPTPRGHGVGPRSASSAHQPLLTAPPTSTPCHTGGIYHPYLSLVAAANREPQGRPYKSSHAADTAPPDPPSPRRFAVADRVASTNHAATSGEPANAPPCCNSTATALAVTAGANASFFLANIDELAEQAARAMFTGNADSQRDTLALGRLDPTLARFFAFPAQGNGLPAKSARGNIGR